MQYGRNLVIEKIIREWKKESRATKPAHYWYQPYTGILTVCSPEAGLLVGKMGCIVEKYENILKQQIKGLTEVKLQEINFYYV